MIRRRRHSSLSVSRSSSFYFFSPQVLEVVSQRGRKGTDPKELMQQLQVLSFVARKFGAHKEIPVLMHLVSSMYDANRNTDECMPVRAHVWETNKRLIVGFSVDLFRSSGPRPFVVVGVAVSQSFSSAVVGGPRFRRERKTRPTEPGPRLWPRTRERGRARRQRETRARLRAAGGAPGPPRGVAPHRERLASRRAAIALSLSFVSRVSVAACVTSVTRSKLTCAPCDPRSPPPPLCIRRDGLQLEQWKLCYGHLWRICSELKENPKCVSVRVDPPPPQSAMMNTA